MKGGGISTRTDLPKYDCDKGVPGSAGPPLKHSGLSELQLMELITHLRMTLEGAVFVDGCMDEKRVPYWKLERINYENPKTDESWKILMRFWDLQQKWEEVDIDSDEEAGTVGVESEERVDYEDAEW